jgi:uncharacterized protein YdhG (YjbR/CyaY superfamily)
MLTSRRNPMAKASRALDQARQAAAQVRQYLAGVPPDARRELRKMREAIRAAAPDAVEGFSYRMPLFRLDGRPLVWYAAFTGHIGMYPIGASIRRACAVDMKQYSGATGTIRFPLAQPPSAALVRKLVRARAAQIRPKRRRART